MPSYLFDEMGMIIVSGVCLGGLGLLVLFEERGCFAVQICVSEEDLTLETTILGLAASVGLCADV